MPLRGGIDDVAVGLERCWRAVQARVLPDLLDQFNSDRGSRKISVTFFGTVRWPVVPSGTVNSSTACDPRATMAEISSRCLFRCCTVCQRRRRHAPGRSRRRGRRAGWWPVLAVPIANDAVHFVLEPDPIRSLGRSTWHSACGRSFFFELLQFRILPRMASKAMWEKPRPSGSCRWCCGISSALRRP